MSPSERIELDELVDVIDTCWRPSNAEPTEFAAGLTRRRRAKRRKSMGTLSGVMAVALGVVGWWSIPSTPELVPVSVPAVEPASMTDSWWGGALGDEPDPLELPDEYLALDLLFVEPDLEIP